MEKETQLKKIITDYNYEMLTFDEAINKILLLFNVSGNEAIEEVHRVARKFTLTEFKIWCKNKNGEVAVCQIQKHNYCVAQFGRCTYCGGKEIKLAN